MDTENKWSNGSYVVEWENEDQVKITYLDSLSWSQPMIAVMDGGDFEYALQVILASYRAGVSEGMDKAKAIYDK